MPSVDPAKNPKWDYFEHRPLYIEELRNAGLHEMEKRAAQSFQFSYSFRTEMDNTTAWTSRMEHYLKTGNENIHFAAILLSLAIVAGLAITLA